LISVIADDQEAHPRSHGSVLPRFGVEDKRFEELTVQVAEEAIVGGSSGNIFRQVT